MIARDIALALDTGARVLFQHVSSAQSAALIRTGRSLGPGFMPRSRRTISR